jgi:hypothetical protein
MKKNCTLILSILILLGIFSSPGQSATISLNPTVDTYIDSSQGSTPYGTYSNLAVGIFRYATRRTLMQFDLSSIPDDATITSAQLSLYAYYNIDISTQSEAVRVGRFKQAVTNTMTYNSVIASVNWGEAWGELPDITSTGWKTWNLLQTGNWDYSVDLGDNALDLYLRYENEKYYHSWAGFYATEWGAGKPPPQLAIEYVPIPSAVLLLGSGLIGLIGLRRKFKK